MICLISHAIPSPPGPFPSQEAPGHRPSAKTLSQWRHFPKTCCRMLQGCHHMHLGEGAARNGHDPVYAPLPGREMSPAWGY